MGIGKPVRAQVASLRILLWGGRGSGRISGGVEGLSAQGVASSEGSRVRGRVTLASSSRVGEGSPARGPCRRGMAWGNDLGVGRGDFWHAGIPSEAYSIRTYQVEAKYARMWRVPRVVNKVDRRRRIAEALHRIAARDGLEGVSVRTVAAEATVSTGAVQREFATKDKLLRFALQVSVDEVVGQFGLIRVGPGRMAFTEALYQVLKDLLPTDERRLARARIWTAFYARAAVDPAFAETITELNDQTRSHLVALLEYARQQGELAPEADVEKAAELLLVLIDGLWMAGARLPGKVGLHGPMSAIEALLALLRAPREREEVGVEPVPHH